MNLFFQTAYQGTGYSGYQSQKDGTGIQDYIARALETALRLDCRPRMGCAGRTDAGVHATGQVIHVHIPWPKAAAYGFKNNLPSSMAAQLEIEDDNLSNLQPYTRLPDPIEVDKYRRLNEENRENLRRLTYSLNSILPADIGLDRPAVMPPNFHARFSCKQRRYTFLILNTFWRQPFWENRALWHPDRLDLTAVNKVMPGLLGERDFAAFTKKKYREERTLRRMDHLSIRPDENWPGLLKLELAASGFLYNMVRIMTALFLQLGRSEIDANQFWQRVENPDRWPAPVTVKPHGLYFKEAVYDWPTVGVFDS